MSAATPLHQKKLTPKTQGDAFPFLQNANILFTDDTTSIRRLMTKTFSHVGAQTGEASNGIQALHLLREFAKQKPFSLAILDLMMPVMNGIETLKEIRHDEDLRHTPVLIMSAQRTREVICTCAQLGISGYIAKPVSPRQVLETANRVLEHLSQQKNPNELSERTSPADTIPSTASMRALECIFSDLDDQQGGLLMINGSLSYETRLEFKQNVSKLFATNHQTVIIDISKILHIDSNLYKGTLADIGLQARQCGKKLLMRAHPRLEAFCRQLGLETISKAI